MNREAYLKSLNLDQLNHSAYEALAELAERKRGLRQMKEDLKRTTRKVELCKADLILSEEYKAGKNAESRESWLVCQRTANDKYAIALKEQDFHQNHVDQEAIEIVRLEGEFALAQAEMEQASASLRFLAA